MVKKVEELFKYLGDDDKKMIEFEPNDMFQMLISLKTAVIEIDRFINKIEITLNINQEWRDGLGITSNE
jgi:hypothetical protein